MVYYTVALCTSAATFIRQSLAKKKKADNLGLPPGGLAVTEVSLGPGGEHNLAISLLALGEGEGEGGGAADNLLGTHKIMLALGKSRHMLSDRDLAVSLTLSRCSHLSRRQPATCTHNLLESSQ